MVIEGTGSGKVFSAQAGINCGSDCNEFLVCNTSVSLTLELHNESRFTKWEGDCDTNGDVVMDPDRSCTAVIANSGWLLNILPIIFNNRPEPENASHFSQEVREVK